MINAESVLQIVSPDVVGEDFPKEKFLLINPSTGEIYRWVCDGHKCVIYTGEKLCDGDLLRSKDKDYIEGKFRDSGR